MSIIYFSFLFIISVENCKKKLKSLKDTFRTNVAKLPKTRSGAPAFNETGVITWPHFKNCLFMKDEFVGRQMISSSMTSTAETETTLDDEEYSETQGQDDSSQSDIRESAVMGSCIPRSPTPPSQASTSTTQVSQARSSSTRGRKRQNNMIDLEREKVELLREAMKPSDQPVDTVRHFLLSLEDDMRSLTGHDLRAAKVEIMQVVNKYMDRAHADDVPRYRYESNSEEEPCAAPFAPIRYHQPSHFRPVPSSSPFADSTLMSHHTAQGHSESSLALLENPAAEYQQLQ